MAKRIYFTLPSSEKILIKILKKKSACQVRLILYNDKEGKLVIPFYLSYKLALLFLERKKEWIGKSLALIKEKKKAGKIFLGSPPEEFKRYKKQAARLVKEKIKKFNQIYNFSYNKIFIRNQRTRWGSCSQKRNLSFNYKIIFLPDELVNYLVVHELCHLKEFNHSSSFWELVERAIPDYKKLSKILRKGA